MPTPFFACDICGETFGTLNEAEECERLDDANLGGAEDEPLDFNRPVYSAYVAQNNSALVKEVCRMYLPNGSKVADVTWGKGVFWRGIHLRRYDFHKSDIITCPDAPYDFRSLPRDKYPDDSFDVAVLDPPYAHNPGQMIVNANYQNSETTRGMYHNDIIELYRDGMLEAKRFVKKGGLIWVKCQDEVESSFNRWSHVEVMRDALNMGLYAKDLFVLVQNKDPVVQHVVQQHARKRHSYLWVFRKPEDRELKDLERYGVLTALKEVPPKRPV
jgi:hypothetical protein